MKICNKILNRNLHSSMSIKYFSVKPSDKIDDTKVSFVKINTNDIKNFGKKFSDDDKKKYMDPFGFLSSTDYKEAKTITTTNTTNTNTQTEADTIKLDEVIIEKTTLSEEKLKQLEEIEKIEDPVLRATKKNKHMPKEFGYKYNGPEPTRYGDWDIKGKCVDF